MKRRATVEETVLALAFWWSLEFIGIYAYTIGDVPVGTAIAISAVLAALTVGVLAISAEISRWRGRRRARRHGAVADHGAGHQRYLAAWRPDGLTAPPIRRKRPNVGGPEGTLRPPAPLGYHNHIGK